MCVLDQRSVEASDRSGMSRQGPLCQGSVDEEVHIFHTEPHVGVPRRNGIRDTAVFENTLTV